MREVDGFTDGVVGVFLEGGLGVDVGLPRDVVGGDEGFSQGLWDFGDVLAGAGFGDLILDVLAGLRVFDSLLEGFLEVGIDVAQALVVDDVFGVAKGEGGLDAAGAVSNHGDGAGGGDSGNGDVALFAVLVVVGGARIVGEGAFFLGEELGFIVGDGVDEGHDFLG